MSENIIQSSAKHAPDYADLQGYFDRVIGKIGLKKMIYLFRLILNEKDVEIKAEQRLKIICQIVIGKCIEVFELSQEDIFLTSQITEYREARWVCYHLISKHSGNTHARIAQEFGLTKRNIQYACKECEKKLSIAAYYPEFKNKYDKVEISILDLLSQLINHE